MNFIRALFLGIIFINKSFGQHQHLTGVKWYLISIDRIETSKSKLIDKRFESTIIFNPDSSFSGVTCNEYKGKFNTSHNGKFMSLHFTSLKKLGCLWLDELEKEVLKHLKDVSHYRLKEELFLFTRDGIRLTYKLHK